VFTKTISFLTELPNFCPKCGSDKIAGDNYDKFKHGDECSCKYGFTFMLRNDVDVIRRIIEVAEIVSQYWKYSFQGIKSIGDESFTIYGNGHFGCRGCYDFEEDEMQVPVNYLYLEDRQIHSLMKEWKEKHEAAAQLLRDAESKRQQEQYEAGILAQAERIRAKQQGQ
jgi:hypothetical protein